MFIINKRLIIDILMTICILTAMSYRIIGGIYHEIAGIIMLVLFIIHNILNIDWYKRLKKGSFKWQRIIITITTFLLLVSFLILIITGILHSKELFGLASEEDNSLSAAWQIHALAAYWTFIFISIHLGIYWSTILNKILFIKNKISITALRITGILISIAGIKECMDRNIGSKLILYYSFDFWHTSEALYSYMASYVSIMTLIAFISYYIIRLKSIKNR